MSDKTTIQWTDATWNPIRGCSKKSPGCAFCYAEKVAARFSRFGQPYHGLITNGKWNGSIMVVDEHMYDPLRWKRPRKIFVNSMSDLFHDNLDESDIARVFAVMGRARQHTFQVLTKCATRMNKLLNSEEFRDLIEAEDAMLLDDEESPIGPGRGWDALERRTDDERAKDDPFPFKNVWLGVSVESPEYLSRVDELLKTPAAIRFISYEPALAAVDFTPYMCDFELGRGSGGRGNLHWIIVGGESGNSARPFHLDWARSVVRQCQENGVACFVKQLGKKPIDMDIDSLNATDGPLELKDSHGGDMDEWPSNLRVREFPRIAKEVLR